MNNSSACSSSASMTKLFKEHAYDFTTKLGLNETNELAKIKKNWYLH